jgi:hypothetical protein
VAEIPRYPRGVRTLSWSLVVLVGLVVGGRGAAAQAPAAHPRLFLDASVRAAWKAQHKQKSSAVAAAIGVCRGIDKDDGNHTHAGYMGLEWARYLQACLVAWAATDDDGDARRAIKFHTALIDDLDRLGDGKGGDTAANRDSGFAIRALGVYTAVSYDWLAGHPGMTPALKARTRQRWAAWTTWYLANGYRARSPSTNYHAGYLAAVTFIAIAQRGEAGAAGDALWALVEDELWGKDMAKAMAPGGVLDGGDWGEGWQYGPLSVVEYAAAARAMTAQGVHVEGMRAWLDALLARTIHAQTPGGGIFAGGDTQIETPNLPPNPNTYDAVLIGDASPAHQAWAASERATLPPAGDFPLWSALAQARGATPTPAPRATWPTSYLAGGTGAFFARSAWDKQAIWFASQCHSTVDVDHSHPNAGNFVLSRGGDDVIVDPTPYGSLVDAHLATRRRWCRRTCRPTTCRARRGGASAPATRGRGRPRRGSSRPAATTPISTSSSTGPATCRWRCATWSWCRGAITRPPRSSSTARRRATAGAACTCGSARRASSRPRARRPAPPSARARCASRR